MGTVSRKLERDRLAQKVAEAMSDPRVVAIRRQESEEATNRAFDRFMLVSADYLFREHGYGRKRMIRYMRWVADKMTYAQEYDDYFETLNEALKDDVGVDVIKGETVEGWKRKRKRMAKP